MEKYNLELDEEYEDRLTTHSRKRWASFVNAENQHLVNEEAIDFLDKCLQYDHVFFIQEERITPKDAMQHPYMRPVVEMYHKINNGIAINPGSYDYATSQILKNRS